MCFNRSQSATKECLCYHELNSCEYFKIKRLYVYLLINKHAIINLFSIQNTKRQEVLIYKKLGLRWFKIQEASRAAITFLTKFSYIETRRQCKEYFEVIPLHCYINTLIRFAIRLMIQNRKTFQISG